MTSVGLVVLSGVFVLQSAEATQRAKHQVVSQGQQSSTSATVTNTSQQEPAADPQPQVPTRTEQPTPQNVTTPQTSEGTTVTINNETIQMPSNGSVQRTIQNDNGATQVDVSVNSDSSGSNTSFNSTSLNSSSSNHSSRSSVSINNSQ